MLEIPSEKRMKEYREARNAAKQICRATKRQHLERKLHIIEEHYLNKKIRNFYQETKKCKNTHYSGPQYLQSKKGTLIGGKKEKLDRWVQYFQELLKGDIEIEVGNHITEEERGLEVNIIIEKLMMQEVRDVINQLRNNKSAGENNLPAEILKYGGDELMKRVGYLIAKIYDFTTLRR